MQKITLITVGTMKTSWAKEGAKQYIDRLRRMVDFHSVELPASKQADDTKQKEEESNRIFEMMTRDSRRFWLLDEYGKEMTSVQFAKFIASRKDIGEELTFVIGGAYGVTDSLRKAAAGSIALSQMTLPHELCRTVFLEQLYRAAEIEKGSGYHH